MIGVDDDEGVDDDDDDDDRVGIVDVVSFLRFTRQHLEPLLSSWLSSLSVLDVVEHPADVVVGARRRCRRCQRSTSWQLN